MRPGQEFAKFKSAVLGRGGSSSFLWLHFFVLCKVCSFLSIFDVQMHSCTLLSFVFGLPSFNQIGNYAVSFLPGMGSLVSCRYSFVNMYPVTGSRRLDALWTIMGSNLHSSSFLAQDCLSCNLYYISESVLKIPGSFLAAILLQSHPSRETMSAHNSRAIMCGVHWVNCTISTRSRSRPS